MTSLSSLASTSIGAVRESTLSTPAAVTPVVTRPPTPVTPTPSRVWDADESTIACPLGERRDTLEQSDNIPSKENADPEKAESPQPQPQLNLSKARRYVLLILLSSAQFFDIFNANSSVIALPQIAEELNFAPGVSQWVLSAYALTFAALQLVGGRMTDIYDPKLVFVAGYMTLGLTGIVCGFSVQPIMLIVFRALQGIGAALTIPSGIAMITIAFPEPKAQANALAVFGAVGAVGSCLGFVIGGIITAQVSWRWVFWVVSILAIPFSVVSYFSLPKSPLVGEKNRSLDMPGVGVLTAGLILFVYAVSASNTAGWGTAQILVPLILSVLLIIAFFFVERIMKDPAVPPRTWTNKSFIPLFIIALSVYWHFMGDILQLVEIFQTLWGWGPLSAALHSLPIGLTGGTAAFLTGRFGHLLPRKVLLVSGQVLLGVGNILYAFADTPDKYWSHILPGMIIAMIGLGAAYVGVTVAVMANARKGEEGVAGALMNTSFQLGATIGLAVVTAITLGVNERLPSDTLSQFKGYQASFWSILAMHGIMGVMSFFVQ